MTQAEERQKLSNPEPIKTLGVVKYVNLAMWAASGLFHDFQNHLAVRQMVDEGDLLITGIDGKGNPIVESTRRWAAELGLSVIAETVLKAKEEFRELTDEETQIMIACFRDAITTLENSLENAFVAIE